MQDRAADGPRLRARLDTVEFHDDGTSGFALLVVPSPTLEPDDLSRLSREFGEALAIGVHTVADLVVYDHFLAGERVRGLTYAGEAGWVRVVGEAEAWERSLFSALKLAELCSVLEEDFEGEALASERAELETLWRTGKLEEGNVVPPADPGVVSRAIEKHFGLPVRPLK
jgi:hypothetical protein